MYDRWVDEVDQGDMVGVMMVDLSAAFDMVDHTILLDKLRIYGLTEAALQWMTSYLDGRSQSVYIDGCLSPALKIEYGVPPRALFWVHYFTFCSEMMFPTWFIDMSLITKNLKLSVMTVVAWCVM